MQACKHAFGCHSCESSLQMLYKAICEYQLFGQNKGMMEVYLESTKKMIENILNTEEEDTNGICH
jgi:hypothetical protein